MINRLAIIGVGLIGGSLALALKAAGQVGTVVGAGRDENNLKLAESLGIIDVWATDVAEAVKDADVVVLAVPMGAYAKVLREISPVLKAGAIVTDVGSTKQHAVEQASKYLLAGINFVAAHPLAGTEKSGAGAAFKELYQNHICILTPEKATDEQALIKIQEMWQYVGANVIQMGAEEHDALLASVSHLPHLAAFALVNAVNGQKTATFDPFSFAAGGFRDFTRIASSSPVMWRDIAMANRQAMVKQIECFQAELQSMKQALEREDADVLLQQFASAQQARDAWLASKEGENT